MCGDWCSHLPVAKDGALPPVCLSPPTSSRTFGLPHAEAAGKIKERNENRKLYCVGGGGRGDGRAVWILCMCVYVYFFFLFF